MLERLQYAESAREEIDKFHKELFDPVPVRDPDAVTKEVIEEEMATFKQFQQVTGSAG